ncbi:MAG TPA: hypothetical protein VMK13_09360, partial [Streptosporangiaceae bacterium]|nr:hypothetical protein [Streptosporangiaceae bacterium]
MILRPDNSLQPCFANTWRPSECSATASGIFPANAAFQRQVKKKIGQQANPPLLGSLAQLRDIDGGNASHGHGQNPDPG